MQTMSLGPHFNVCSDSSHAIAHNEIVARGEEFEVPWTFQKTFKGSTN
jgi:hypothetical protein